MDSLLESSRQGLTLSGLNVAPADDVRAASISVTAAQMQGNLINAFCEANSLRLNANKTELMMFTKGKQNGCGFEMVGQEVQINSDRCKMPWGLVVL